MRRDEFVSKLHAALAWMGEPVQSAADETELLPGTPVEGGQLRREEIDGLGAGKNS